MRPEIGIPAGMITGLSAQVIFVGPGLPALWWIGAVILILMAIVVMAYLVALSLKKAKEEWILVVWSRPEKFEVVLDYKVGGDHSLSPPGFIIPKGSLIHYDKENDKYIYSDEKIGLWVAVWPRHIMDNPETFDLP